MLTNRDIKAAFKKIGLRISEAEANAWTNFWWMYYHVRSEYQKEYAKGQAVGGAMATNLMLGQTIRRRRLWFEVFFNHGNITIQPMWGGHYITYDFTEEMGGLKLVLPTGVY